MNVDNTLNTSPLPPPITAVASKTDSSKAGNIAYEIFGLIPVIGTFVGIHHAYKAITSDDKASGWEIAKIITQIASFLIIPQVILGLAHGVKELIDWVNYPTIDDSLLPPPITQANTNDDQPVTQGLTAEGLPFPMDAVDINGLPLPMNYIPT